VFSKNSHTDTDISAIKKSQENISHINDTARSLGPIRMTKPIIALSLIAYQRMAVLIAKKLKTLLNK
jgi:type IV secretory pathway TrbL component